MKRSKKYKESMKLIDKSKSYNLKEAVKLLPKISTTKFDSSVEIHINLNLSEKQKKTVIKGSTTLPHQVGAAAKIAVITTLDHISKAKDADFSGGEDLIKKIKDGWDDFDILIATPDIMVKLAALGKVLGPKGKMPNPKNGTVTNDIEAVVKSYKKGKLNFKSDDQGGIHQVVGKCNMEEKKLLENILVFFKAVLKETQNLQTVPFKSVFLSPSMGPSIKIDVNNLIKDLT